MQKYNIAKSKIFSQMQTESIRKQISEQIKKIMPHQQSNRIDAPTLGNNATTVPLKSVRLRLPVAKQSTISFQMISYLLKLPKNFHNNLNKEHTTD